MSNLALTYPQLAAWLYGEEPAALAVAKDFCSRMREDYRINRFFNDKSVDEHAAALFAPIKALLASQSPSAEELHALVNDYFTAAFARHNRSPSLVTGNDFAFLLDIAGGKDMREIIPLCESHAWLIKLIPDDDHFDAAMEHLAASMVKAGVPESLRRQILDFAERGRDAVLARGPSALQAA